MASRPKWDQLPDRSSHLGITTEKFIEWLQTAKRGDRIVYHRGYLFSDTAEHWSEHSSEARDIIRAIRSMVYEAHSTAARGASKISLIQRRNGFCDYDYIAERTKHGHPPPNGATGGGGIIRRHEMV